MWSYEFKNMAPCSSALYFSYSKQKVMVIFASRHCIFGDYTCGGGIDPAAIHIVNSVVSLVSSTISHTKVRSPFLEAPHHKEGFKLLCRGGVMSPLLLLGGRTLG